MTQRLYFARRIPAQWRQRRRARGAKEVARASAARCCHAAFGATLGASSAAPRRLRQGLGALSRLDSAPGGAKCAPKALGGLWQGFGGQVGIEKWAQAPQAVRLRDDGPGLSRRPWPKSSQMVDFQ